MRCRLSLALLGAALLLCGLSPALSPAAQAAERPNPEQIFIVGSSTVFPFAATVVETFGRQTEFMAPHIEPTGSGGGIDMFCAGLGLRTPDIANASRAIKPSEIEKCADNGVTEIIEVRIGFDGIVLANAITGPEADFTIEQVFLALAKTVPDPRDETLLIANPYTRWSEIDTGLPDVPIEVLGPPPTSGTRDAFVELVMEEACDSFPAIAALKERDEDAHALACASMREDGRFVEAGESDNIIVTRLLNNPDSFGIFGYSFLEQNEALRGHSIDGVEPLFRNIANGSYPVARSLFFYAKAAHIGRVPGLQDYLDEFVSDRAIGEFGYLVDKGLIPLPQAQRAAQADRVLAMATAQPRPGTAAAGPGGGASPAFFGLLLIGLSVAAFYYGRAALPAPASGQRLHSVRAYHGLYVALWCGLPALILLLIWLLIQGPLLDSLVKAQMPADYLAGLGAVDRQLLVDDIRALVRSPNPDADPAMIAAAESYLSLRGMAQLAMAVLVLVTAIAGLSFARRRLSPEFRARNRVETIISGLLIACSAVAVLTTVGIVLSLLVESWRFFSAISPLEFLFGLNWSPQTALRADQVGASGAFGAVPLFAGTLQIGLIALLVAVPIGLMAAIYLSEYAGRVTRGWAKPALEVLAGIPTVVFGFFALLVMAPAIKGLADMLGIPATNESALAAGIVMGIMIVPFVSSLSDDVINAVPQTLRDGATALGATSAETMRQVVLPAALPGIVGAVLLAASRAVGETMIVLMSAGLAANLTLNPFESVTTVTVQIATLLVGDQEFDSPKTLSAFALGLSLFAVTLVLNVIALAIVKRYREAYD